MDKTKRPLRIPPEFATYAEKHDIFDLYKRILEQLIIDRPANPLPYLVQQLKKDDDDVPQIIILGPPSSGKATIAKMICSQLRTIYIDPTSLISNADSNLRREVSKAQMDGNPIPNDVWVRMITSRLKQVDCVRKGWVMHSVPSNRQQVLTLQSCGIYPKHYIVLNAPDQVLVERAVGKRVDPITDEIYHVNFDWPHNPEVVRRLEEVSGTSEDEVVPRLVEFYRYIEDVNRCYSHVHTTINADQPKADVFAQVMTFISTRPRSVAPHIPRVILIGPKGSGRRVQAALLASKYGIINISFGQLVKQVIAEESDIGNACKPYVEKRIPVPDALLMKLLDQRLSQLDCVSRGWVLHGYPKTRSQAEQLTDIGHLPNRVYFLDAPHDSIIERLAQRSTDAVTGERYHGLYKPARSEKIQQRLTTAPGDDLELVRRELAEYEAHVDDLVDCYEDGQRINADQDAHTVFECIESILVMPLPKQLMDKEMSIL